LNSPRADSVDGQLAKSASTKYSYRPGDSVTSASVATVETTTLALWSPCASHSLYAVARGTPAHWKCTGDVTLPDGISRMGRRLSQFCARSIVKRKCAESAGSQPAKYVTTHHSIVPAGTFSTRKWVWVVSASAVGAPSFTRATSTYFTAPLTGLQTKSTGGATLVAPFGGETSSAPVALQFCACGIVKCARCDIVDGQASNDASTLQT
jgi:hypothetical protein